MRKRSQRTSENRRGAALVEFAVVAPLLLTLILGTLEIGYSMRASTILNSAVREGGRLACMDFTDSVGDNETANQKVIRDIKNFITANGLDGSAVDVTITSMEDGEVGDEFDLEDSSNNLKLFRIRATLPYADVSLFPVNYMAGRTLAGDAVFRATRASLAQ